MRVIWTERFKRKANTERYNIHFTIIMIMITMMMMMMMMITRIN